LRLSVTEIGPGISAKRLLGLLRRAYDEEALGKLDAL
jgi:hypothetical protein